MFSPPLLLYQLHPNLLFLPAVEPENIQAVLPFLDRIILKPNVLNNSQLE